MLYRDQFLDRLRALEHDIEVIKDDIGLYQVIFRLAQHPDWVAAAKHFELVKEKKLQQIVSREATDDTRRELAAEIRTLSIFSGEAAHAERSVKKLTEELATKQSEAQELQRRTGQKGGRK